jgi:hypothetical protein
MAAMSFFVVLVCVLCALVSANNADMTKKTVSKDCQVGGHATADHVRGLW